MTNITLTEHVQKGERNQQIGAPVDHSGDREGSAFDTSWKNLT